MKCNYFTGSYGENQYTILCCKELNEYALETEGECLATETEAFDDMFDGLEPEELWVGLVPITAEEIDELPSTSLKEWVAAKEI